MQKKQSDIRGGQGEEQSLQECGAKEKCGLEEARGTTVESELETGLTLEEAFEQIEEVLAHLETEEITLEQSFQEYNRGMKLLQHCNETIDRVEKKVLQMNEDGELDEF